MILHNNFLISKKSTVIVFITLLPYISRVFYKFNFYIENTYFSAISIIQVITLMFFIRRHLLNRILYNYKIELLFVLYIVLSILFHGITLVSLSLGMWICMPILLSISVISYCHSKKYEPSNITYIMLNSFVLYCCFVIVYNIFVKGLFIIPNVRMTSPGGGSVIFGYTVAIYFSVLLLNRTLFSKKRFIFMVSTLILSAVATQSRGAVWPIIAMLTFYLLVVMKISHNKILLFCMFCIIALIVFQVSFRQTYFHRIFNTHESARMSSSIGVVTIYEKQTLSRKIFGAGLGGFFPYQEWVRDTQKKVRYTWDNCFYYDGIRILVQPHNTFLYLLMETGVVGTSIFILCIFKRIAYIFKTRKWLLMVLIATYIFINLFDSVMIVQPGTASIIWMLIFINIRTPHKPFVGNRLS